jgi:hypothetical protein
MCISGVVSGDLLNRMIEDMIRLAIDPVYPPPAGATTPPTPRPTASTVPISSPIIPPIASVDVPESEILTDLVDDSARVIRWRVLGVAVSLPSPSLTAATSGKTASKRPNGWEMLYTERSQDAMAATRHAKIVQPESIPVCDIPAITAPPSGSAEPSYKISGERRAT